MQVSPFTNSALFSGASASRPSVPQQAADTSVLFGKKKDAKKTKPKGYQNPTPDFALMENVGPLADNLMMGTPIPRKSMKALLQESPLLGKIPFLSRKKHLPKLSGRFKIKSFDFPQAELDKLKQIVRPDTAVFMAPNHPEYMTDWLLDKWISDQAAPKMASFAAAGIVQGPGGNFWLKNNLIANNGGKDAENYAVDWALQGHGVLLHPEGTVHWNGNKIRHLVPGVANMAIEAANRSLDQGLDKPVYMTAPVWKLAFTEDVSKGLHGDMADLEKRFGLPRGNKDQSPAERLYDFQQNLLGKRYTQLGLEESSELQQAPFFERASAFMDTLYNDLRSKYEIDETGSQEQRIHRLTKAIRTKMTARKEELKAANDTSKTDAVIAECKADQKKVNELLRLRDFHESVYGVNPTLSQEEIAESLKAVRSSLVMGTKGHSVSTSAPVIGPKLQMGYDGLATQLPEPVGQRTAHIRVTEPIEVTSLLKAARENGQSEEALSQELMDTLRNNMQETLDLLNSGIQSKSAVPAEPNPFYVKDTAATEASPE